MTLTFRKLRADEIDVRISTCNEKGVSLLLYKDARCDQNILDETVGAMNWQRHHLRDNANCIVSIWSEKKECWVQKEDTGTESFTEKEKGLASDSFKRACFNWGIGRELYTAPFMWVAAKDLKTLAQANGKWKCNDYFTVTAIEYDGDRISMVEVMNGKTRASFQFGKRIEKKAEKIIGEKEAIVLANMLTDNQKEWCKSRYGIKSLMEMTVKQYTEVINTLKEREQDGEKSKA